MKWKLQVLVAHYVLLQFGERSKFQDKSW